MTQATQPTQLNKPVNRKFNKKKPTNKKQKPKWIWSNRDYAQIATALENVFPDMRHNMMLEKHQVNEIGRSKYVVFNIDDLNNITFSFQGNKVTNVNLVFDNPMKAAIWATRRLRYLQKIDPEHKIKNLDQAWRMLEFFYNKLEEASKAPKSN